MPRHNLSDSQLEEFAAEHLKYEVDMLLGTAQLLAGGTADQLLTNALLESFTVHLRALVDFLWQPANLRSDDAVASDYFVSLKEWEAHQPPFPSVLNPAKSRTGKEIVHLTYSRLSVTPIEKQWHFVKMAQAIVGALIIFRKNAASSKIGDALIELQQ